MAVIVAFTSCGSDDSIVSDITPTDKLSEQERQFVGCWDNQGNKGLDFLFFSDGTARACPSNYGFSSTINTMYKGNWVYNPNTNILATDINGWQWQVTLITDDSWAGISVSSTTAQNFSRIDNSSTHYISFFRNTTLKDVTNPDSTISLGSYVTWTSYSSTSWSARATNYTGYYVDGSLDILRKAYAIELTRSDESTKYEFDYKILTHNIIGKNSSGNYLYNSKVIGKGTLTLPNLDSYGSNVLTFTGTINGKFVISEEE